MPALIVQRHLKRYVTTSADAAGGTTIIVDIPNDAALASISVRVNGQITVGTVAAVGLNFGGAANVIKAARIVSQGGQYMPSMTGNSLRVLQYIQNEGHVPQSDPALTTGDKTFNVTLKRFFACQRMQSRYADRAMFPAHLIKNTQLQLDIAPPTDILVKDTTTTLVYKTGMTIDIFCDQVPQAPVDPNFYLVENYFEMAGNELVASTGKKDKKLNLGGYYRFIALVATSLSGNTRIANDAIVGSVSLDSNFTNYLKEMQFLNIQADNQDVMHLPSLLSGVAVLDFTRRGTLAELLNAEPSALGSSDLMLSTEILDAAATHNLTIIGVRLFDNRVNPLVAVAKAA